jgi:MFS family permease
MERILDQSPATTGLLLTPVPIALGVMAPVSGILADRVGPVLPTVVGMLLAALALGILGFAPLAPLAGSVALLAVLGVGLGLFTPPNNSTIMGSAPANRLGVAGGMLNMTRSVGTSVGVAATGAVLAINLAAQLGAPVERTTDAPPAALLPALAETFLFLAAMSLLTAVLSATRGGQPAASAGANVQVESGV